MQSVVCVDSRVVLHAQDLGKLSRSDLIDTITILVVVVLCLGLR